MCFGESNLWRKPLFFKKYIYTHTDVVVTSKIKYLALWHAASWCLWCVWSLWCGDLISHLYLTMMIYHLVYLYLSNMICKKKKTRLFPLTHLLTPSHWSDIRYVSRIYAAFLFLIFNSLTHSFIHFCFKKKLMNEFKKKIPLISTVMYFPL